MLKEIISCGAILGILAGCVAEPITIGEDFSNAVRQNIAAQIINPEGVGEDESDSIDGQKAQQAVDRYREAPSGVDDQSLIQGVGIN